MNFLYNKKIITQKECTKIRKCILDNEEMVKGLGPDIYPLTAPNSLSGRHTIFNWLTTEVGEILIPKLHKIFTKFKVPYPISIQCWANTFRKGEGIETHAHGTDDNDNAFISGHIFISGPTEIGTYYNNKKRVNTPGEMTLFKSTEYHHVPKNTGEQVRISVALDIFPKAVKDNMYILHDNKRR